MAATPFLRFDFHKLVIHQLTRRTTPTLPQGTTYSEVDQQLRRLLEQYCPERQRVHPEYPFWRLQSDGVWTISADGSLERRQSNTDPRRTELLRLNARGGFTDEVYNALSRNPELIGIPADELLATHFPADVHKSILADVGLIPER